MVRTNEIVRRGGLGVRRDEVGVGRPEVRLMNGLHVMALMYLGTPKRGCLSLDDCLGRRKQLRVRRILRRSNKKSEERMNYVLPSAPSTVHIMSVFEPITIATLFHSIAMGLRYITLSLLSLNGPEIFKPHLS